jgi:hypothetical protein
MKNTAKIALASLMLALTFIAAPQIAAADDFTITKSADRSSPAVASSVSSGPISITNLAAIVGSAIASLL